MAIAERELVVTPEEQVQRPTGEEVADLFNDLREELAKLERPEDALEDAPRLVAPHDAGDAKIPPSVFRILRFVVHHMSRGDAIALTPLHMQLTTQQAADFLGVSRPFLVKQLEERQIPYTLTGKHRRLKLLDVLAYKERRDRQARETLALLAREAQDAGEYFG
jgi:excisionase family DNA binding protein